MTSVFTLGNLVNAANEGQIAGGDIYRVKNITANTDFANTTNATKCETLQYKVRLHNPGPGVVHQVNVKVTLPTSVSTSNVSTATITSLDGDPRITTDTATVNLSPALGIQYISGSTQLLDANNGVLNSLPDGITAGGVNIGNVGVSLNEIRFVQFKAKTDCPQTPPPPTPPQPPTPPTPPTPPPTPPLPPTSPPVQPPTPPVTVTPVAKEQPGALPDTGPGSIAAVFAGASAISSIWYYVYVYLRRFTQ
jgi:hypothetical protein